MANYCFTKYWVEGEESSLCKLAALIGEGKNVTEILPEIGIPFSDLSFREEGCPYWYDASISNGVLRFTEEAKWEQSQCLWKLKYMEGWCQNQDSTRQTMKKGNTSPTGLLSSVTGFPTASPRICILYRTAIHSCSVPR